MDKHKLKNFIIIMLALVNLFLLVIVISNGVQTARINRQRDEALRQVLFSNGISLDPDVSLDTKPLPEVVLVRNLPKELSSVRSLIGSSEVQDLGGSIIYYSGGSGKARFRGSGGFQLVLDPEVVPQGDDPVSSAASAMKKLGLSCPAETARLAEEGDSPTVVLGLEYKGAAVFNVSISCYFSGGSLSIVEGQGLFDEVGSKSGTEDLPQAATIIARFLEHLETSGQICTRISSLEAGYFSETSVVNQCSMRPVWCVTTDTGTFYFDGLTGDYLQPDIRE